MQAIILAAGMGKRLKELTQNNTKCMVKVNGVTLIDRMLHQIDNRHLSRIIIVVGYEGKKLIDYINTLDIQTPITYINNPIYDIAAAGKSYRRKRAGQPILTATGCARIQKGLFVHYTLITAGNGAGDNSKGADRDISEQRLLPAA